MQTVSTQNGPRVPPVSRGKKTKAPFWKLEEVGGKSEWVEAKDADDEAAAKWNENR